MELLFVDTNIWLDFYRLRGEMGRKLFERLIAQKERLILSYQVEIEFDANRHNVIREGWKAIKRPEASSLPGLLSDSVAAKQLRENIANAQKCIDSLQRGVSRVLADPVRCDSFYRRFKECCQTPSDCVLTRESSDKAAVREKAHRRFLHGCPPRKTSDTSIGDAMNWEWLILCAQRKGADVHIVSRDSDYGMAFEGTCYVNDQLSQEFKDRVGKRRKLVL